MRVKEYSVDGAPASFEIIYLFNFENQPLPAEDIYTANGDGINISANYINAEVVEACHRRGKRIGVWIRAKDFKETDEFYNEMFKIGTDFICADFPLRAMEARAKFLAAV